MSTWATRRAALRAAIVAAPPVPIARVDLTAFGDPVFTPPAIESLDGLSAAARTTKLQNATWLRYQIAGVPGSNPFHLGSWSPTHSRGQLHTAVFYPRGYGDAFVGAIVIAATRLFHRVDLDSGAVRFFDAWDPVDAEQPADSKFAQIHIVHPFEVIARVAA